MAIDEYLFLSCSCQSSTHLPRTFHLNLVPPDDPLPLVLFPALPRTTLIKVERHDYCDPE